MSHSSLQRIVISILPEVDETIFSEPQTHYHINYSPNAGVVDEAPKAEEEAPNAGVAVAPNTPVDVPLPNRELPVCAPKAGVVLPNGLAPNGLVA